VTDRAVRLVRIPPGWELQLGEHNTQGETTLPLTPLELAGLVERAKAALAEYYLGRTP
jgi:hypothetical protein